MKDQKYQKELGATAACAMHLRESTTQEPEARTLLMGDAWFGSVRAVAVASSKTKINMKLY